MEWVVGFVGIVCSSPCCMIFHIITAVLFMFLFIGLAAVSGLWLGNINVFDILRKEQSFKVMYFIYNINCIISND